MRFIKTPTPDYHRHNGTQPHRTGFLGRLAASLLKTRTPVYKTAPEPNDTRDR